MNLAVLEQLAIKTVKYSILRHFYDNSSDFVHKNLITNEISNKYLCHKGHSDDKFESFPKIPFIGC